MFYIAWAVKFQLMIKMEGSNPPIKSKTDGQKKVNKPVNSFFFVNSAKIEKKT